MRTKTRRRLKYGTSSRRIPRSRARLNTPPRVDIRPRVGTRPKAALHTSRPDHRGSMGEEGLRAKGNTPRRGGNHPRVPVQIKRRNRNRIRPDIYRLFRVFPSVFKGTVYGNRPFFSDPVY